MPGTEKVEELLSKSVLEDFERLGQLVDKNVSGIERLIAAGVELNTTLGKADTFKKISQGAEELAANEKALTAQNQQLQQAIDALTKKYDEQNKKIEQQAKKIDELTQKKKKSDGEGTAGASALEKANKKLADSYSADARALAEVNEQQKLVNQANRLSARETLGLVDAYEQLEIEAKKASREAQNLAVQFGANSKEAQEASARALVLVNRLKEADINVGKFNRNVGNYSGALKVLEKGLVSVRQKIEQMSKSAELNADVLAQLQKEEKLLTQLLDNQVAGFTKASAELKENTVALQKMAAAGLEGTEAYKELFKATASLKDEVGDLSEALKNASPDDLAFNAAADAARALVGVYGLAQSVTAAFGVKNEELEETLVKLQAAETALQSIEAIRAAFKKESALQQYIQIGLNKILLIQTYLDTAAQSKNILVKYSAIAAQKALNAVMALSTGPFGAILLLLGLLVLALTSFAGANKEAVKSLELLNAELDNAIRVNDRYNEEVKRNGEERLAALKAQFATEGTLRKEQVSNLRAQFQSAFELEQKYKGDVEAKRKELVTILKKSESEMTKAEKERAGKLDELIKKYEGQVEKRKQLASEIRIKISENERAAAEEAIEARQTDIETLRIQIGARKAIAEKDAADTKRSYADRIQSLRDSLKQEELLINKQAESQRLTPDQSPEKIKQIEVQRRTAIEQARKATNDSISALNREAARRERDALFEIARISVEAEKAKNEEIAANEEKSFQDRSFALFDALKAQEAIIEGTKNHELTNAELTAEERLAIEAKANQEILNARAKFGKDLDTLAIENLEKQGERNVNQLDKETEDTIIALNDRYAAGKISLADYERERLKIEKNYHRESLQLEIDNLDLLIEEYKRQGKDITALEAARSKAQRALSDDATNQEIDNIRKVKEAREQLAMGVVDAFNSIVQGSYDKEKNELQEQIDLVDQRKEQDIAVAEQTITDKQKQADAIAVIEAKAAAEKTRLEREQRKLDVQRAKFEKANTIANIVFNTARGVIAALTSVPPNVPLSIYVGAIGAVSLAKAVATPVPAFKDGGTHTTGGPALVGDGFRSEYAVAPDGTIFKTPAIPTIMNLPKGTQIYANDQKALEAGIFNDLSAAPITVDNGKYFRSMTKEIGGKLDRLTSAVKGKKPAIIKRNKNGWEIIEQHGGIQRKYLNSNLQG